MSAGTFLPQCARSGEHKRCQYEIVQIWGGNLELPHILCLTVCKNVNYEQKRTGRTGNPGTVITRTPVITGIGVAAPNGLGLDRFWKNTLQRKSGVTTVSLFDAEDLPCRIAGEVSELRENDCTLPPGLTRATLLALHAARLALTDARLVREHAPEDEPVPVILGTSTGSPEPLPRQWPSDKGADDEFVYQPACTSPQAQAVWSIQRLGDLNGPVVTLSGGWTAGLEAVSLAAEWVRMGRYRIALAGAVEAPLSRRVLESFLESGGLAARADPEGVPRPFDRDRDGWVLSEGAAVVVVESATSAWAREMQPYACVAGCYSSGGRKYSDMAESLAQAIRGCLAEASLLPEHIQYVCANATGERTTDVAEIAALKRAFGRHAYRLAISSIKGVVGNPLAAAGPMQVAAAAMSIREKRIPPTANLREPDPQCDLDCVRDRARQVAVRAALVNAHGRDGNSRCIVMTTAEGTA